MDGGVNDDVGLGGFRAVHLRADCQDQCHLLLLSHRVRRGTRNDHGGGDVVNGGGCRAAKTPPSSSGRSGGLLAWRRDFACHCTAGRGATSSSVPGMGMNQSAEKKMTGSSDSNRSEGQGGDREGLSRKKAVAKVTTAGTRTGREAGRGAMSVLGNAKSDRHRKTRQVEPGGTGLNGFMHLTRGGLPRESGGEVSRGRSSEEARRKAGGAKGRRTTERATKTGPRCGGAELSETGRERQLWQLPIRAGAEQAAGLPRAKPGRVASRRTRGRRRQENAQ